MRYRHAALIVAVTAGTARADRGGIVVYGAANEHARGVVTSTFTSVFEGAGWQIPELSDAQRDAIAHCAEGEKPWRCIEPIVRSKTIDRVVVVAVAPDASPNDLVLTATLAADGDQLARSREPCQACGDAALDQTARILATTMVAHAKRFAQAREPVRIEKPAEAPPPPATRASWPWIVVGAGVAMAATGTYLSLRVDPPPATQPQPKYLYSGPGIGLAVAGVVAASAGVYLWLHSSSSPVVTATPGGGTVGWVTAF